MNRNHWTNREMLVVVVVIAALAGFVGFVYGHTATCNQFFSWSVDAKNGSGAAYDDFYHGLCGG